MSLATIAASLLGISLIPFGVSNADDLPNPQSALRKTPKEKCTTSEYHIDDEILGKIFDQIEGSSLNVQDYDCSLAHLAAKWQDDIYSRGTSYEKLAKPFEKANAPFLAVAQAYITFAKKKDEDETDDEGADEILLSKFTPVLEEVAPKHCENKATGVGCSFIEGENSTHPNVVCIFGFGDCAKAI